jgi:hypothetical protein
MQTKYGVGSTHVITRLGNYMLKRWGIWTPYFTILISKIYPIEQVYHNHEGDFISFLLIGSYWEDVEVAGVVTTRHSKFINVVRSDEYHRVHCEKPVWTLLFMGKARQNVTAKLQGKVYPYTKIVKEYK